MFDYNCHVYGTVGVKDISSEIWETTSKNKILIIPSGDRGREMIGKATHFLRHKNKNLELGTSSRKNEVLHGCVAFSRGNKKLNWKLETGNSTLELEVSASSLFSLLPMVMPQLFSSYNFLT